ncbi:substrate-binding domain-containing protein [Deinococcus depolymerans]|uniref:HTH cro/C1-type domain-containing protein n=1 Tax=Deinococcus depolymerans TaxID=392408 RepID=A0ABN1C9P8_9DEIO
MTTRPDLTLHTRVRERRERLGLRPGDLARDLGISRQALHKIETGSSVPGTLLAFTLARALHCRVDDLFSLRGPGPHGQLQVRPAGPLLPGTRVVLARLPGDTHHADGQLLAVPLPASAFHVPADGHVTGEDPGPGGTRTAQLLAPVGDVLSAAARTAVLTGCDPALELLITHAARLDPAARVILRPASSLPALHAVAAGQAHAAGLHLWDETTGTSNLPFTQRTLGPATLFTLWTWEQGLLLAPGNPRQLRGPGDLSRPDVRLATREPGSGSRLLLDHWLRAAGVPDPHGRAPLTARSPLEAAALVASGQADAAPGPRSAALAAGLAFLPLQTERFDLAVPDAHARHPGVAALLGAARSAAFRADLQGLGGYDAAGSGEPWQRSLPHSPAPLEVQ